MPENDHANTDSDEADEKNDSTPRATVRAKPFRLRRIVVGGIVAATVLLFLSIYLPHMTERVKFFTANFISLVVLFVVAVQSYISRKQWEAMEKQSRAMQDQLVVTQNTIKLNERAVIAAERNVEIAKENRFDAMLAGDEQGRVANRQLELMGKQLEAMQGSLEETRRMVIQNERAVSAVEVQATASKASADAAALSARSAEQSAQIAAQSFAIAERPHIYIKSAKLDGLKVGKPTKFEIILANGGRVTAFKFGMHVRSELKDNPLTGILEYGTPPPEAVEAIPPAHEGISIFGFATSPLTQEQIARLQDYRLLLIIFGEFWYEDGAGRKYREPYCRMYLPDTPEFLVQCPAPIREKQQASQEIDNTQPN